MTGVVVSPLAGASPAPAPTTVGASPTLVGTVHANVVHSKSDWMSYHDGPVTEDDLFLVAEEMANEFYFGGGVPDNERPKWKIDSSGKDVVITFGESREKVWTVAKGEIKAYRARVKQLSGKNLADLDPLKDVLELYLGKAKPLIQLMESSLGLSYKKVCHFLGTYCVQKANKRSVPELYDLEEPRFADSDLMPEAEYRNVWTLISKSTTSEGRNKKHFWEKFQARMNEAFNDVNVLMAGSLFVSLDDDKKKASIGKGKDMQGLKQHVLSDKRKGIVGHTAVSPATLLTLGVCWEMEGETSYQCYVKLVKEIFGTQPNLDKVTFCSDRGYWILDLLKFLLANSADVHGTVRRQPWYGLTFDTDLKEGDTRVNIDKIGPSTLITASADISNRVVSINGFRNGTGGVALSMSTLYHGPHWECEVDWAKRVTGKIPLVVSDERRRGLVFRPAGSNVELDDEAIRILGQLDVEHTTEFQGHPEWFIARKFSFSSKTVANMVPVMMRMDRESDERQQHWVVLDQYLDTSSGIGDGGNVDGEDGTVAEDDEAGAAEVEENGSEDTSETQDATVDSTLVETADGMIKDATDTAENNTRYREKLIAELKAGEHKDVVGELVRQMGGKVAKTHKTNVKTAVSWMEAKPQHRPFLLLTLSQLKVKYRATISPVVPSKLNRPELIAVLSGDSDAPAPSRASIEPKTPVEAVVQSAFLSPLKGDNAELCKLGHAMESVYAVQLLTAGKSGIIFPDGRVLIIQHLFRAGLLQKRGKKHQKDSPDYILIGLLNGTRIVAVVEMKGRFKVISQESERGRFEYGNFGYVTCDSPELRKYLLNRGEALQCAHHASTLSVDYVLFVTGDRVSMTGGVLIEYNDDFLSSYDTCIDDMYNSGLKWAYEAENEAEMPIEEIKAAVPKASVRLDFETFMKHLYLWKELTRDKNLPLPPCTRILPIQDAFWNATKYGSDVKTQYCQKLKATLPTDAPGAKAWDRMQMTIFSDIHKGTQMLLVNEDLSTFPSLEHFRNTCSKQLTFRKCMLKLSDIFLDAANGTNNYDTNYGGRSSSSAIVVSPTQDLPSATAVNVPNASAIRRKTKDVALVSAETGRSPKRNTLKRLMNPTSADERVASKRFKSCSGCPIFRVGEDKGDLKGAGGQTLASYAIRKRIGIVLSAETGAVTIDRPLLVSSSFVMQVHMLEKVVWSDTLLH